jgi:hypothetical protein
VDPYTIVLDTFKARVGADPEPVWQRFLHDGFLANSSPPAVEAKLDPRAVVAGVSTLKSASPASDNLEVVFLRDYKVDDGRTTITDGSRNYRTR